MPEDHEVLDEGATDEGNTHKTSDYYTIMHLYVANIDKNDKNTWRIIYEEIAERYFAEVKRSPRVFIYLCKNNPNDPQKNPADIKKNLKTIALEESLYAQLLSIYGKSKVQKKDTKKTLKENTCFK